MELNSSTRKRISREKIKNKKGYLFFLTMIINTDSLEIIQRLVVAGEALKAK